MDESLVVRFELDGRPLSVASFRKDLGLVFETHADASPLNLAVGLQPVFPQLLDPVRLRHDWRSKEFALDVTVEGGALRFSGFRGDREGLPAGVYDVTLELESYRFLNAEQRITIDRSSEAEMILKIRPDRRRVRLLSGMDRLTSTVISHEHSKVDGEPLREWLGSTRPRAARQACLLNILTKLRVPIAPSRGFPEPLTPLVDFVFFAEVDRVYCAAQPTLIPLLERLVASRLWVKEGRPRAAIHELLLDSMEKLGIPDAQDFELISYRQGGRNCLQIVVAEHPDETTHPLVYADVDIDLGNPLWDLEGLIVHLGEVLDSGQTDHFAIREKLNRGDTKDFVYYEIVDSATPAAA
jgi:hypothetical protein